MKEKNMFDALENADQSVIDRLSAEFPPQDNREKKKIFKMSERKFNNRSGNTSEADNHSVSGVEVYKKPKWQVFLSIAAAFVIVAGGITGGIYAKKHLGRSPVISTETEKKTAPFGDFAELEYKLCDYNNETVKQIITQNDENATILLTLLSGSEISQSKREKLADFFNNYDYKELPDDKSVAETVEIDISEINTADERSQEKGPSFVYDDGNEARLINIYEHDGIGVISYTIFHYEERDGELRMTDKEVTEGWQIDYELFKSTINEILTSDDENGGETPVNISDCPIDLEAYDFIIPDPDSETSLTIYLDDTEGQGRRLRMLPSGDVIPLEKRRKLAEFFDTWEWEETDTDCSLPTMLASYEEFGYYALCDDYFIIFELNRDSNTLIIDKFSIKPLYDSTDPDSPNYAPDGEGREIVYQAIDYPKDYFNSKKYKIDYDIFKDKFREILGDDFIEYQPDPWSFLQKEWALQTDENDTPAALSADDINNLYDMFRKCRFKEEGGRNESLSTAEAMEIYNNTPPAESDKYAILTCDYYDFHNIIYFETKDDKTLIRYYDYGIQGANIPDAEYNVNIYNYSCVDTALVDKIKEYYK